MIVGFKDRDTERFFHGEYVAQFEVCKAVALRKLDMLHAARTLPDLRLPPGNQLEALAGNRAGQYSIRINRKWRICFLWTPEGPDAVEIVDYH